MEGLTMSVLRVFLAVCVLVVVGASADASASSTATGTWTLTVTFAGTGTGLVTSDPAGIVCTNVDPSNPPQGTCSAQFQVGVAPWMTANPSGAPGSLGSVFGGFANTCPPAEKQPGVCQAGQGPTDPTSVQVTFNPKPIPCIVNRVIDQPLAMAKSNLRERGCKVGTVRYAYSSSNINFGEVISQNPRPHWQRLHGAVDLVVSKGRRGP